MNANAVWLYQQSQLTQQALDLVDSEAEIAFWLKRLRELQGRISFEQRHLHEYEIEESL